MSKDRTRILVVDDEEIVRESLSGWLAKDGYALDTAPDGPSALEKLKRERWSILLVDLKMPGMDGLHVLEAAKQIQPDAAIVIMTAYATVETAVEAMKLGAYDYLVKPFDPEELSLMMVKIVAQQQLVRENVLLRKVLKRDYRFRDFISKNPAMHKIFDLARSAAKTASTILVLGESGTGKELLARAVHAESPRRDAPFIDVSCAALTETLLESELFGHEKGSFTGAVSAKPGLFEVADGGTLFIDEIGEMPGPLQAKLLRVLEDGLLRRVGSIKERRVDVRLLAATNRNLASEVHSGRFREDLYYRINVMSLELPPLRKRTGDVALLVRHFLGPDWHVDPQTLEALEHYSWPGNVRQLSNAIERAKIMADGRTIRLRDLPREIWESGNGFSDPVLSDTDDLATIERSKVVEVLRREHGNKARAARALGIERRKLYRLLEKYAINQSEWLAVAVR